MSQTVCSQNMMSGGTPDRVVDSSEVANFYAGRNILITGSTGFLGKLIVERILRSCPDMNTMFLLVRMKKGKSPEDRIDEIFDDVIFDRLKWESPGFTRKIVLIKGDLGKIGLGLSFEQRERLRSTHILIHSAATVRFDEKLRIAADINVRGTQELLSLAKTMVDLKAFVHVSTAYSNCVLDKIDEKFYPPPIDSEKLLSLLDILDDKSLDQLTPFLLGKWPNTYTFTKSVAEDTVRVNCQGLPVCIVRPSIITATSEEPIAGWTNNVYGATGILVGAAVGLLHSLHCDSELIADLIPADYVVNNIIVAAWDTAKSHDEFMNEKSTDKFKLPTNNEPPIYNVVSSCQQPITWGELMKYCEECALDTPSTGAVWYYTFGLNKSVWIHNLYVFFLHLIPAAVVDSLAWFTGQKPRLWAAYKRIHKFSSVIEYFTLQQWEFCNKNVMKLRTKMCPADRDKFDFDLKSLDWEVYGYCNTRGLRAFILKDPLDTVPQGRLLTAKLRVAHYTFLTVLCGIFAWLLWTLWRFIGL